MAKRVAYCTGFWCTNIGNAFFSLGVEHVLKRILGEDHVTVVSDYQTYTTGYGKRLFPDKNQLEYLSKLDVDYLVLAGPVLSKYFLPLWEDVLINLEQQGIRYIILSAGIMKMTDEALLKCTEFFQKHPPYAFSSRDKRTFDTFGKYADHAYDGICFSFFAPDYYHPCGIKDNYFTLNFDKISEPLIWSDANKSEDSFEFEGKNYRIKQAGIFSGITAKTDRFCRYVSGALSYQSRSG